MDLNVFTYALIYKFRLEKWINKLVSPTIQTHTPSRLHILTAQTLTPPSEKGSQQMMLWGSLSARPRISSFSSSLFSVSWHMYVMYMYFTCTCMCTCNGILSLQLSVIQRGWEWVCHELMDWDERLSIDYLLCPLFTVRLSSCSEWVTHPHYLVLFWYTLTPQHNENENQIDQILKEVAVQKLVCVWISQSYMNFVLQASREQDAIWAQARAWIWVWSILLPLQ